MRSIQAGSRRLGACAVFFAATAIACAGRDSGEASNEKQGADESVAETAATGESVELTAAQIAHGKIRWAVVTESSMTGVVEVPGQLVANDDRTARLAAPAQARVLAVHVSPGDRVGAGARLVTLQSPEASAAQADVGKAEAELSSRRAGAVYARSARDRAERLLAVKAIPRQDYERAVADDELARAAVAQAVAELRRARSNAGQLGVDTRSGAMTLRSPIAGVVTSRDVAAGAVVSPGTPLVTVSDPSSLWLTVALPEPAAAGARPGATLRFTVPIAPADTFTARIQSVSGSFDPATRSLPVRGIVSNPGGRLRPELFARVWVETGISRLSLTVPDSAVQRSGGKTVVFIYRPRPNGGGTFEKKEVELGAAANGRVPVIRGLDPGDVVVVAGAYAVKAQMEKGSMPDMEM